jgi:hypothetical protein
MHSSFLVYSLRNSHEYKKEGKWYVLSVIDCMHRLWQGFSSQAAYAIVAASMQLRGDSGVQETGAGANVEHGITRGSHRFIGDDHAVAHADQPAGVTGDIVFMRH